MLRRRINFTILILATILLSSCAAGYRPIRPASLDYHAKNGTNDVEFSYKYDVMLERNNRKYAKKELKHGMHLVAVQLKNNSDQLIMVKDHITFYANGQPFQPVEPMVYTNVIKQKAGFYFFYLFLSTLTFNTYDRYGNVESSFPIGLIIGPSIALGNFIGATSANSNLLKEFHSEFIMNKVIKPGETVSGLMAVSGFSKPQLTIHKSNYKIVSD